MHTMLFGVATTDPVTYGAIVVVLALAVLAACWIPARRAAAVAPIEALRAG
jgi:ABC-type lipoprotein release transport system permease subunit